MRALNIRAIVAAAALLASTLITIGVTQDQAASQAQTKIHVFNMDEEPVGATLPTDWTSTNSTMTASAPTPSRLLFTAIHQDGVRLTISMSAALEQTLSTGTYPAALNEPTDSRPALAITSSALAETCRYSNSFYEILDLGVSGTDVTRLAVDLQYTCSTASEAPWTLISLRYNSSVPTDEGAPVLTGKITGVDNEPVPAATLCLGNPVNPVFSTLSTNCAVTAADGTYRLNSKPFLALTQDRDRPDDYFIYVIPSLSSGYRNDCWYTGDGCATAGYLSLHDDAGVAVNTNLDLQLVRGCANEAATIVGTEGDDTITGTPEKDVIVSLGGNDTIFGEDGDDFICTGFGNNVALGGNGEDRIFGSTGEDVFRGQQGNDWLWGDAGDDFLRGGAGDDHLSGVNGKDDLNGGQDNDEVEGGEDDDILRGSTGNDLVKGGGGSDTINGNGGEDVVYGDAGNDTLVSGGPRKDSVFGGDGNDVLKGLGGPDYLSGGPGNDELRGGQQNDELVGNDGDDVCNGGAGDYDTHTTCETVSLVEIDKNANLGGGGLEPGDSRVTDFFGPSPSVDGVPTASG